MNHPAKPLLSRVADSAYWMARYIERAENVARFTAVNFHLILDLPSEPASQWQALVETTGDARAFRERYGEATAENAIQFLAFDRDNRNSIASCLYAARENARSMRDTISSEMWQQANRMYLEFSSSRPDRAPDALAEFFRRVRVACHLFDGITDGTMSHNEPWHFLRLGRNLERADKTTRILDVKYFMLLPSVSEVGTPYDDIQWSALLKSVSGFEMYRKRYGRVAPECVVEFMLRDSEFPRAVRYCIGAADSSLHIITGTPPGSFSRSSERRLGLLRSELDYTQTAAVLASGLHEFLDGLEARMNAGDQCILGDFFTLPQAETAPATSPRP